MYVVDYLFWYSLFIILSGLSVGMQNYCRNDGSPGLVGIAVIISTVCNIFGDWLLIYPFSMGTKGAAIATGVSQTVAFFIMLTHFIRKKGVLRFGRTKPNRKLLFDIIVPGLPEGIGQLAAPVMTLCINLVLVNVVGDIGVNSFSIISYVVSFTVAVFFGTSEALHGKLIFVSPLSINLTKTVCFYIIQTNCSEGILLVGSNTLDKAQIEKSVLYPAFFFVSK